MHRKIQQILDELRRAGWEEEDVSHLGRIFYEFAGKYHSSATRRLGVPPDTAWRDVEKVLEHVGDCLSRAVIGLYSDSHRRWMRSVLRGVKVPSSPPVAGWYLQKLAVVLTDSALTELPTLRDGILKAVRRNNLDAFHKIDLLLDHSSADDLVALEDQARALLSEKGRKAFPKDKVGHLVDELVVRHAVYRLARLLEDVDPREHSRHLKVLKGLFEKRGASFHPGEVRKLPLVTLAGVLAVEGRRINEKQVDPRYFLFFKALAAKRVPVFVESLLRNAPEWVRLVDGTFTPPGAPGLRITLSKKDLVSQARALERFPTCHTPLYGEHADRLLFTPCASGVAPVVAVATDPRGERVVGRANVLFDGNTGNIYITSVPLGSADLEHYVEAAEAVARRINRALGQTKFRRILVGDLSRNARVFRLNWGVHDAYLEEGRGEKRGAYYFVGRVARRLE